MDATSIDDSDENMAENEVVSLYMHQYKYYFDDLEKLGRLSVARHELENESQCFGGVKAGAKPLSGIRGLYFSKGSWRVKYLDDRGEAITCYFNYNDTKLLIAGFKVAYSFLKKVIEYKRQVNKDDGLVLEELSNEELLELDNRKKKKDLLMMEHKSMPTLRERNALASDGWSKSFSRDYGHANSIEYLYESQEYTPKTKRNRGRPRAEKEYYQYPSEEYLWNPENFFDWGAKSPVTKKAPVKRPRRLSRFQEKFESYMHHGTKDLIEDEIFQGEQERMSSQAARTTQYRLRRGSTTGDSTQGNLFAQMYTDEHDDSDVDDYMAQTSDSISGNERSVSSSLESLDKTQEDADSPEGRDACSCGPSDAKIEEPFNIAKLYKFDNCLKK